MQFYIVKISLENNAQLIGHEMKVKDNDIILERPIRI